jgi:hypothetical protein
VVVCVIIAPILFFSSLNPGLVHNPILETELKLQLNIGANSYEVFTRQGTVQNMTAAEVSEFKSRYTVKDDDGDSWL